jgi:hypothetical protein
MFGKEMIVSTKIKPHREDRIHTTNREPKPAPNVAQPHIRRARIIQRVRANPNEVTAGDLLQFQSALGNQVTSRFLAQSAPHRPVPTGFVTQEVTHAEPSGSATVIQRAFFEEGDQTWQKEALAPMAEKGSGMLEDAESDKMVGDIAEMIKESTYLLRAYWNREVAESTSELGLAQNSLLALQLKVEEWRHRKRAQAVPYIAVIRELTASIRSELDKLSGGIAAHGNVAEVVAAERPALEAMAIRIVVKNAGDYSEYGGAFAQGRASGRKNEHMTERWKVIRDEKGKFKERIKMGEGYGTEPEGYRGASPNFGAMSQGSIKMAANQVEINEEAICSEFAAAAANRLINKGVPVEIVGFGKGGHGHNFVIVGRPKDTGLSDYKTWPTDCLIIDPWLGGVKMKDWLSAPTVVYTPSEHLDANKSPATEKTWRWDPEKID